jgi:hypothetical protein
MRVKRTATIVFSGGALVAWFAGAATSNRPLPDPILTPRPPIDARGDDLAAEIDRLHERLRPTTTPHAPGRNLFRFNGAAVAPPPAPSLHPAAVEQTPAVAVPSLPPLRLAGIGEDPGPDGPLRMAFISGDGQLFIVKIGDTVTPRYRVTAIAADVVELLDLTDNTTRRLAMR